MSNRIPIGFEFYVWQSYVYKLVYKSALRVRSKYIGLPHLTHLERKNNSRLGKSFEYFF